MNVRGAKERPFFSVVVCCWNSITYIKSCVESVLEQSENDFEIVFVDGGSSDGTLEYIESVTVRKIILRDVRGGIAAAMNAGILAASGEVIAHLHSDDYYIDDTVLRDVRSAFDSRSDVGWVYGRFKNDIDGVVTPPPYPFQRFSWGSLLRRNIVPHVSTFVRSSVFKDVGVFDGGYKLAMDYDLWLRIGKKYTPVQLDRYLGVFRRHAGSSTSKFRLKSFNEDFKARFSHSPVWLWPEFAARYVYRRLREV